MVITGIEPQKHRRDRYSLFVDGEFVLGLRSEVLVRSGLRRGDTVTRALIDTLKGDEVLAEAKAVASRYLGRRRRTETEIRRKLSDKGIPPDIAETVIGSYRISGLVDDEAYVKAFIHDAGLGKPAGSALICARLRAKGISRDLLKRVVPEFLTPGEEAASAARLAASYAEKLRRSGRDDPPAKMKTLIVRYLAQRGFTGTAREDALRHVFGQSEG